MVKNRTFTIILEPEEDGGYSVSCPALPGCVSQGDSREEALVNIREAILLVLEVLSEDGRPPGQETADLVTNEVREVLEACLEDGRPLAVEVTTLDVAVPDSVAA